MSEIAGKLGDLQLERERLGKVARHFSFGIETAIRFGCLFTSKGVDLSR